jgi:hypothetical protein
VSSCHAVLCWTTSSRPCQSVCLRVSQSGHGCCPQVDADSVQVMVAFDLLGVDGTDQCSRAVGASSALPLPSCSTAERMRSCSRATSPGSKASPYFGMPARWASRGLSPSGSGRRIGRAGAPSSDRDTADRERQAASGIRHAAHSALQNRRDPHVERVRTRADVLSLGVRSARLADRSVLTRKDPRGSPHTARAQGCACRIGQGVAGRRTNADEPAAFPRTSPEATETASERPRLVLR